METDYIMCNLIYVCYLKLHKIAPKYAIKWPTANRSEAKL